MKMGYHAYSFKAKVALSLCTFAGSLFFTVLCGIYAFKNPDIAEYQQL